MRSAKFRCIRSGGWLLLRTHPKKELFGATEPPKIGEQVTARVVKVLEGSKLTLSIREKAYLQIQKDAERRSKNCWTAMKAPAFLTIRQHRGYYP